MKIAFIGGGNMGEAIVAAVLAGKLAAPTAITVSDVSPERRDYLKAKYGITVTNDNAAAAKDKDIVVLVVKPQHLPEAAASLKGKLPAACLVLSIAAGITISSLQASLGHRRIARAMPNTPARIGRGMSGWVATPEVSAAQREQVRAVLGAMGREIYFDDEKYLDMVTAVSGSGPAYLFLFAEAMTGAAVAIGLSQDDAAALVAQTLLGASELMRQSGETPAELCRQVASKGGTTARALEVFESGGLRELVEKAVRAAYERARELGK